MTEPQIERILELLKEHGIPADDPDVLKHTLEDHDRWRDVLKQPRPEIICLCGDVFTTAAAMFDHLQFVHLEELAARRADLHLRALVEKWRAQVRAVRELPTNAEREASHVRGECAVARERCADELEALLADPPSARPAKAAK